MNKPKSDKWGWREKRERKAFLALEDGTVLHGHSVGAACDILGEVVFNTGMTGYQEILTDPSYSGQIVTMTCPEIGNTGVNVHDVEARKVFVNGFVMHEMNEPSSWRTEMPLRDYLASNDIPAIAGIDTRALTTRLRNSGTLKGFISVTGKLSPEEAVERARAWSGLDGQDYAAKVTCDAAFDWDPQGDLSASWGIAADLPPADLTVVAYDYGIKWNILRRLREQGINVKVVSAKTSPDEIVAMKPDGVFLSNGPADPAALDYAIDNIRQLIGKVPLWGICLGHQLIGLALGAKTYRLKFGHHGCNQPVKDLDTGAVHITSQNHNYAVDPETLPANTVDVTHINLNDQTVEGLRHRTEPVFCVQFHPEAAPGPHDATYLFKRFRQLMLDWK
jgi:carbamoyl-phosphate synthase small subunit